MFRLVHDFSDADDLDVLTYQKVNLTIDKDSGLAVLMPGPVPGENGRRASFAYAKKLRPPLTVTCDVATYGGRFGLHVSRNNLGTLNCLIRSEGHTFEKPFELQVDWREPSEGGKVTATTLCHVNAVALEDPIEKPFRLPLPNVKATDAAFLEVFQGDGDQATTLSRFEVRGRPAPIFGIAVDERSGTVFVRRVFPNGLCEKAGFQVGDVLLAINGKRLQTKVEATDMLGHLPVGEDAVFTIQRADKTQDLRIVAE
jgi:hypothetical protein